MARCQVRRLPSTPLWHRYSRRRRRQRRRLLLACCLPACTPCSRRRSTRLLKALVRNAGSVVVGHTNGHTGHGGRREAPCQEPFEFEQAPPTHPAVISPQLSVQVTAWCWPRPPPACQPTCWRPQTLPARLHLAQPPTPPSPPASSWACRARLLLRAPHQLAWAAWAPPRPACPAAALPCWASCPCLPPSLPSQSLPRPHQAAAAAAAAWCRALPRCLPSSCR